MADYETARHNMIESQIRPNGITDGRVIAALGSVPREKFVADALKPLAYMDEDVRIASGEGAGAGRVLMEPMAYARLLQLAQIDADDIVLDVGCASGYSSAVAAHLAESVVAVEADAALAELASETLSQLEIGNVAVVNAAHAAGCPNEAPFDVIVINGSIPKVPSGLLDQLNDGGRLVAVVGQGLMAQAQLWTRHGDTFANRREFDASVAPLPGIEAERPAFTF